MPLPIQPTSKVEDHLVCIWQMVLICNGTCFGHRGSRMRQNLTTRMFRNRDRACNCQSCEHGITFVNIYDNVKIKKNIKIDGVQKPFCRWLTRSKYVRMVIVKYFNISRRNSSLQMVLHEKSTEVRSGDRWGHRISPFFSRLLTLALKIQKLLNVACTSNVTWSSVMHRPYSSAGC